MAAKARHARPTRLAGGSGLLAWAQVGIVVLALGGLVCLSWARGVADLVPASACSLALVVAACVQIGRAHV